MVLYFGPQRKIWNVYRKRRLTVVLLDIPLVTVVGTKAPPYGPYTGSLAPGVRQRAKKKSAVMVFKFSL